MSATPFEDALREAEAALGDLRAGLSEALRTELIVRITRLLVSTAERERARNIQVCRQRAQLWRTTLAARSGPSSAQEEARGRANEAESLADLLSETEHRAANG